MKIEIRNNKVTLDGYVNVVDRYSRPIVENGTKFIEKILPGAFKRALDRAHNVDWLLDHEKDRKLGSTNESNIKLFEDNVGLRAICTTDDAEIIEKAKSGKLRGWSFAFNYILKKDQDGEDGLIHRSVSDLELYEVSLIDEKKLPCYIGTSIEMRSEECTQDSVQIRSEDFVNVQLEYGEEKKKFDYSMYRNRLKKLEKNKEETK